MLERKIIGMPPGERLGIVRFIVALAALAHVLWQDFSSLADLPFAWYQPQGLMRFLPPALPAFLLKTPAALAGYKITLVIFLIAASAGIWTRTSLVIGSTLYFVFLGISNAYYPSLSWEVIPLYMMFFLIWLPCGESFSLDQKIFRRPSDKRPSLVNGWAVFLLRAVFCFSFFQAGLAKIEHMGTAWLEAWNLKHFVIQEGLTSMVNHHWHLGMRLAGLPDFAWGWLAGAVLFSELLFPLVLFSWRLRQIFPVLISFLHGMVLLTHSIFSPELFVLPFIFYDWDRLPLKKFWFNQTLPKGTAVVQTNLRRRSAFH